MFRGELGDLAQPFGRRGVEPAFALNGFDEDRRGRVEAARRVGEPLFEQLGGVDVGAVIAVIGFVADVAQGNARAAALPGIAGAGERAERHRPAARGGGEEWGRTVRSRWAPGT